MAVKSISKATVTGTVFRNPQTGYSTTGASVSNFVLNIGDKEELLIRVIAKRTALAEVVASLSKGTKVVVDGVLQTANVKDENGKERKIFEIDANEIELMGAGSPADSYASEDIVKFSESEMPDELIGEDEIPF